MREKIILIGAGSAVFATLAFGVAAVADIFGQQMAKSCLGNIKGSIDKTYPMIALGLNNVFLYESFKKVLDNI